jgi:hypothetical protein
MFAGVIRFLQKRRTVSLVNFAEGAEERMENLSQDKPVFRPLLLSCAYQIKTYSTTSRPAYSLYDISVLKNVELKL